MKKLSFTLNSDEYHCAERTLISDCGSAATGQEAALPFQIMMTVGSVMRGIDISGSVLQGSQSLITIIAANSKVNALTNLVALFNPTNVSINQGNTNH